MKPSVIALAPMPPEKVAYALARYSRSPEGIADSLRWVYDHSSERFWEQFYFQYGHASIADLGHVVLCFENLSELAAICVEDERLWDGQAKSSRYQDFSKSGYHVPAEAGEWTSTFRQGADRLFETYRAILPEVERYVRERNPRPESMKEGPWKRATAARAFDVVRYVLPLAVPTNVGQVVSIRTLEKQIGHLYAAPWQETRELAERMKAACGEPPMDLWGELSGANVTQEPLAPTLARHAQPNAYWDAAYRDLTALAREELALGDPEPSPRVDLVPDHAPETEIVATLLYRVSAYPYRQILAAVEEWPEGKRQRVIDLALRGRGREELLPEFQSGYRFLFDVLMDVGGWRDLHRHRRCQQVRQPFTFDHGYETPALLGEAGVDRAYREVMDASAATAEELPDGARAYLLPFGYRMRCLFKMDYAEIEYISRLRSGVKGHFSYRTVAWEMKEALSRRHPALAERIEATPPWIEDSLTR